MNGIKLCLLVLGLVFATTQGASAHLVKTFPAGNKCGGDHFKGTKVLGTVTDPAGDVFTLTCVDNDYFQGTIFVKATDLTTDFGRCLYDGGVNIINYEVDANDNFKEIEWVNVKASDADPHTSEAFNAREAAIDGITNGDDVNKPNDPTAAWLDKVGKYLTANKLDNKDHNIVYEFPFSPNNQTIANFENGTLTTNFILTPGQANASYLDDGFSPIPLLNIDPVMRLDDAVPQEEGRIPEPATLLLVIAPGFVALRRRKRIGKTRRSLAPARGDMDGGAVPEAPVPVSPPAAIL